MLPVACLGIIIGNIKVTPHNYAAFHACAKSYSIYKINYDSSKMAT